jgi:hypothetical protein
MQIDNIKNKKGATAFLARFIRLLLQGLFSVLLGYKKGYRKFSKEFNRVFPETTEEDMKEVERRTPPNMRWWCAQKRQPSPAEANLTCRTCNQRIGARKIKECPNCHVVMHAECYDRPYGDSYQTPGCKACSERCYSR